MIEDRQVFIGFFTRRYPVYNFWPGIHGLFQILRGNAETPSVERAKLRANSRNLVTHYGVVKT